jgi:hypothetical protein
MSVSENISWSTIVMVSEVIDKVSKDLELEKLEKSLHQIEWVESKEKFDERLYKMAMVWWYEKQSIKK